MKAQELRQIAEDANGKRRLNRPHELRDDLIRRMTSLAKEGRNHIEFCFHDEKEIVLKVIELLKDEGFKHTRETCPGATRFEW